MGGVCLTLYGFIAVSGLKMFKEVDLNENKNLFTVSAILIAGIGGLAIRIPYHATNGLVDKTITITSIATALILGICTYAIINALEKKEGGKDEKDEPESLIVGAVAPDANFEVGKSVVKEEAVEEAPAEEAVAEEAEAPVEE